MKEQKYKIVENKDLPKHYHVAAKVDGKWIQVSKRYTHKGFAKRAMERLIKETI